MGPWQVKDMDRKPAVQLGSVCLTPTQMELGYQNWEGGGGGAKWQIATWLPLLPTFLAVQAASTRK